MKLRPKTDDLNEPPLTGEPPPTDIPPESVKPPALERARELQRQKRYELSKTQVVLKVTSSEHARSEEVVNFCIAEFQKGTTWDELRYKLGCGPASIDRRWRAVRKAVVGKLAPETEHEAIEDSITKRTILLERLEQFLDDVDSKLLTDQAQDGSTHHYFKMKLDTVKTLLEENNKEFMNYLELRKVKALEKGNRGVSILVQNNFSVARPKLNSKEEKKIIGQVMDVIAISEPKNE